MRRLLAALLVVQFATPLAWGWGAHVHRTITYVALGGLPPEAPAWLREPAVCHRVAFQANQVDRWRGWRATVLKHENDPEHYLDVELLDEFGLTLDTVPKLRREYLRAMAIAKHEHPERVSPYDAEKDHARTHEWPGLVLHAVAEHYAKLQAAFHQVRILEQLNEPARRHQLEQAREVAIYHMGTLSHFVGDIAQPLHTTRHYNGWVGDNPAAYKWREKFHAYIDEGFADQHKIGVDTLRAHVKFYAEVDPHDPWKEVLTYLRRSHAQLQPLYELERDGRLDTPAGEELIVARLTDAASMYSALLWAAYVSAEPSDKQVETWVYYNGFDAKRLDFQSPVPTPARKPASAAP